MAKILERLWFDAIEPPNKSFYWVKVNEDNTYSSYIYGNSGWEEISRSTGFNIMSLSDYQSLEYKDPASIYVVQSDSSVEMYLGDTKITGGEGGGGETIIPDLALGDIIESNVIINIE